MRYIACSISHHDGTFTIRVGGPFPREVGRIGYHREWVDKRTGAKLGYHSLKDMRKIVSYEYLGNGERKGLQEIQF